MTIIGRSKFAQLPFALLVAVSLFLHSAGAQELTRLQQMEVANCAIHGGGGWVELNLYDRGNVKFSYVSEPALEASDERDPRNIYVAFWNARRTGGELLVFHFFKSSHRKDFFVLNNQGHIVSINGRLEIRDALWGIYTHRKLQALLPKLKRKPAAIMAVSQVRAGTSICKTPLDLDHAKEWER